MGDVLSTEEIARLRRYCTLVESIRLCDSHELLRTRLAEAIREGRSLAEFLEALDHRDPELRAAQARIRFVDLEAGL